MPGAPMRSRSDACPKIFATKRRLVACPAWSRLSRHGDGRTLLMRTVFPRFFRVCARAAAGPDAVINILLLQSFTLAPWPAQSRERNENGNADPERPTKPPDLALARVPPERHGSRQKYTEMFFSYFKHLRQRYPSAAFRAAVGRLRAYRNRKKESPDAGLDRAHGAALA